MPKRDLTESWIYQGRIYGPGEGVEVPEELTARLEVKPLQRPGDAGTHGKPLPQTEATPRDSSAETLEHLRRVLSGEITGAEPDAPEIVRAVLELKFQLEKASLSKADMLAELEALGHPGDPGSTKDELWEALMQARAGR